MSELHVNKIRSLSRLSLDAEPRVTIGRSSQNQVVLSHPQVSRSHCVIEREGGAVRLRDLGSRHGTRVNGSALSEVVELRGGDVIGIGPFQIVFDEPASAPESGGGPTTSTGPIAPSVPPRAVRETNDTSSLSPSDLEAAARREILEEQVRTLRRELKTVLAQVEAEAQRSVGLQEQSERQTESLRRAETECETTRTELESARGQLETACRRAEQAEHDLTARSRRLEETAALAVSLKDRLDSLEAASQHDAARVESLHFALSRMDGAAQQLREMSQRLSLVQRGVRALEALWLETSDWVEESEEGDPEVLEQAIHQRDSVGEKLENAHAERDAVVSEIQVLVEQLRRAGGADGMGGAARVVGAGGASGTARPGPAPQPRPARSSWIARTLRGAK